MKTLRTLLPLTLIILSLATSHAQRTKINEKNIIGCWTLSSVSFVGENKVVKPNVARFKIYEPNGEYACVEILQDLTANKFQIIVHEYGTYSYRNGTYIEMGRKDSKITSLTPTDMHSLWRISNEHWKKVNNISSRLKKYILQKCRMSTMPPEINNELSRIFKTHSR